MVGVAVLAVCTSTVGAFGAVVSTTVMVCSQSVTLPQSSVATHVRVMTSVLPQPATLTSLSVTVTLPQVSVAVATPVSTHYELAMAALKAGNRSLGFPTITFPCEMASNLDMETVIASMLIVKYGGLVVLSDFKGESLFPLLLERLNIYTDPQRPMTTEQGIYPIGNPGEDSPVLITSNFSLTYFIVSGEIESSRVPTWLLVQNTDGLSVLTAWAAGKFDAERIAKAVKANGLESKLSHKKLVIPGHVSVLLGEIEEELPDWKILVGPRDAVDIPSYYTVWQAV